jgi:putative component of toxin-antitoxin plasmid stabilization module
VLEYKIDFGPGYRVYFGRDGDVLICPAHGWHEKAAAARHQVGDCLLDGLQGDQARAAMNGDR